MQIICSADVQSLQQNRVVSLECLATSGLNPTDVSDEAALFNMLPVPLKVSRGREVFASVSSEDSMCLPTAEQLIQIKQKKKVRICEMECSMMKLSL